MSIASHGEGMQDLFVAIRSLFMEHDDRVDYDTFLEILDEAGLPMQEHASTAFSEIDTNDDGFISFQEFFGLAMSYMQEGEGDEEGGALQDPASPLRGGGGGGVPFDLNDDIPVVSPSGAGDPLEIVLTNDKIRELREVFKAVSFTRYGSKYAKFEDMTRLIEVSTIKYEVTVGDVQVFFQNEMVLMNEISEEEFSRVIKDLEAAWLEAYGVGLSDRTASLSPPKPDHSVYSSPAPASKHSAASLGSGGGGGGGGSPYTMATPVADQHSFPLDALYDLMAPFYEQGQWRDSADSYVTEVLKQAMEYLEQGRSQAGAQSEEKESLNARLIDVQEEAEQLRDRCMEAEGNLADSETRNEAMRRQLDDVQAQDSLKQKEVDALRAENLQLGRRALLVERLEAENRTLEKEYEDLQEEVMRNEQKSRVMGEIALRYGGEALRQSVAYRKVRATLAGRQLMKPHTEDAASAPVQEQEAAEEAEPPEGAEGEGEGEESKQSGEREIEKMVEDDATQELDFLNLKIQKMAEEIKALQLDKRALLKANEELQQEHLLLQTGAPQPGQGGHPDQPRDSLKGVKEGPQAAAGEEEKGVPRVASSFASIIAAESMKEIGESVLGDIKKA